MTLKGSSKIRSWVGVLMLMVVLVPSVAYGLEGTQAERAGEGGRTAFADEVQDRNASLGYASEQLRLTVSDQMRKQNYVIAYDRALIDAIGTQAGSGHGICCPSFSCAYADAVMDGTVRDHSYYRCYSCSWRDWGGGNSSYRDAGAGAPQLREAYDQISQGRPVVIHVSASYGEHWIALIGYKNAKDPDNLTLSNFIALDPWDGSQVNAGERFRLYGDGCQHISQR